MSQDLFGRRRVALTAMILWLTALSSAAVFARGEGAIRPQDVDKFRDVAGDLRCPTCTGISVLDSDAEFSVQIKKEVEDQLRAGKTEDEIKTYFVERYGPWILRVPPKTGFNQLAWGFPIALLIGGPFAVWFLVWRRRKDTESFGIRSSAAVLDELEQLLESARAKVAHKHRPGQAFPDGEART